MLTSTTSSAIKVYSDNQTNTLLVVGLGQYLGKDWIHVVSGESNIIPCQKYQEMKNRMPPRHVNKVHSGVEQVCIMQTHLL